MYRACAKKVHLYYSTQKAGLQAGFFDLAAAAGYPKAQRAVGNIMHTNKLMLVLPCHRIIKSDGKLGGYAGDEDLKLALLELEQNYK